MAGYGLSAKQYNEFFLENCDAVRAHMTELAGREASARLTSEAFGSARDVMSRIPSEGLVPELCAEILSGAVQRVEDELRSPVQEECVQEAPAAESAAAEAEQTSCEGTYIAEAEPEEQETAAPASNATAPAGWATREAALVEGAESSRSGIYESQHMEPLHIVEPELGPELEAELLTPETKSVHVRHSGENAKGGKHGGAPFWRKLLLALLVALILFQLWIIAGILMGQGILPRFDMGYTWFNANVYYFF